ncbi:MAG: S-ribosylhomocysteine lyase [Christensenellaceae bacterium]|jgi:S-ribosylhomocysteine lyase|nr:S-ribosylhomocysteine lyase [Christensenellaceae bacterium]
MKTIASFQVNHDVLQKGFYISRVDGDVVTYDLRMKTPNQGDYLSDSQMHTIEHLYATFARNSARSPEVVYVGPMGCRTGFYFLVRDSLSHEDALRLTLESLRFIAAFQGEIPGSKRRECGNYLDHDLPGAQAVAKGMIPILEGWSPEKMAYER